MSAIVVPAAGRSQRFKESGIFTPKPLLEFSVDGEEPRTMLEWAVRGAPDWPVHVGLRKEDMDSLPGCIPSRFEFHEVQYPGEGQASTVEQVVREAGLEFESILVVNVDSTFVPPVLSHFVELCIADVVIAGALVTRSTRPDFSYILPLSGNSFHAAVEKERVSDLALVGAYYFFDGLEVIQAFAQQKALMDRAPNGEFYISSLFKYIPEKKFSMEIGNEKILSFNTPEEWRAYIRSQES